MQYILNTYIIIFLSDLPQNLLKFIHGPPTPHILNIELFKMCNLCKSNYSPVFLPVS